MLVHHLCNLTRFHPYFEDTGKQIQNLKIGGFIISTKNNTVEYFTRFPNIYIRGDIKKQFGVSRKFYITYILIDRYRSVEDFSWITLRKILNFYGYKTTKNKPKAVKEILDVLEYMINNKMIEVKQDLDSIGYDTGIEIQIIPENFDHPNKFTKITSSQIDTIMMADSSINKENLLIAFLYINSYIGFRKNENEIENINIDTSSTGNPLAFWKSIQSMAKDLAMSRQTITDCIDYLTTSTDTNEPLLIKHETGYIPQEDNKPPKQAPNIYVLNKEGYEKEIQWALNKMMEIYKVDHFIKRNN